MLSLHNCTGIVEDFELNVIEVGTLLAVLCSMKGYDFGKLKLSLSPKILSNSFVPYSLAENLLSNCKLLGVSPLNPPLN